MSTTTFRFLAFNDDKAGSLDKILDSSAAAVGYRRYPIFSDEGPSNDALIVFSKRGPSRQKLNRWPDHSFDWFRGDKVVVRLARNVDDRQLSINATMMIGENVIPRLTNMIAGVGDRITYSERDRDALLRAATIAEALSDCGLVGRVEVIGELGEKRGELPTANGHWVLPLPLETSRKRATREFIRWAANVFGTVVSPVSGVFKEVPVFTIEGVEWQMTFRVPYNLINGTLLPIQTSADQATRKILDLELPFLRRCWSFRSGLDDVRAEYGQPTTRLGGYDPAGTGLSSLETIRDQWLYSGLLDGYAVVFREYQDHRIAVNILEIV